MLNFFNNIFIKEKAKPHEKRTIINIKRKKEEEGVTYKATIFP